MATLTARLSQQERKPCQQGHAAEHRQKVHSSLSLSQPQSFEHVETVHRETPVVPGSFGTLVLYH